jgi:hypothetical protein
MPPVTPALPPPARPWGLSLRGLILASVLSVVAAFAPAGAALAEKGLPKPYVSPSLDAVLLPITAEVRKEFKLGKKAAGVVVVSVDPGGVGELYGLEPGEVITELNDKVIRRPVDLDSMIRYGLNDDSNYFFFDGTWKNRAKKTIIYLTNDDYNKPVAIEDVSKWRAYNTGGAKSKGKRGKGYRGDDGYYYTGGGFYYYDFCDSYYDDFYEVYDYTVIYVDQVIYTDVYITSYNSDDAVFWYDDSATGYDWGYDDYYISEVDEYVYSDEFYAEYESTEVYYEDQDYDPETGLSYAEAEEYGYLETSPESYDESYVDDGSGYEEPAEGEYYDEPVADEYYEEPAAEEYYEEPAAEEYYEEPAAEEYYEEPAAEEYYEEPAAEEYYEEPAAEEYYEEPAAEEYYEEPAAEEYYEEPAAEEYYEEPAAEEYYEEPAAEEYYEEPASGGGDDGCYDEYGNYLC